MSPGRALRQSVQRPAGLCRLATARFFRADHYWNFRAPRRQPGAERPYRAFGYPFCRRFTSQGRNHPLVLLLYKTQTTWPGLLIVLAGVPVYFCVEAEEGGIDG